LSDRSNETLRQTALERLRPTTPVDAPAKAVADPRPVDWTARWYALLTAQHVRELMIEWRDYLHPIEQYPGIDEPAATDVRLDDDDGS
jgi:hypothetical protein